MARSSEEKKGKFLLEGEPAQRFSAGWGDHKADLAGCHSQLLHGAQALEILLPFECLAVLGQEEDHRPTLFLYARQQKIERVLWIDLDQTDRCRRSVAVLSQARGERGVNRIYLYWYRPFPFYTLLTLPGAWKAGCRSIFLQRRHCPAPGWALCINERMSRREGTRRWR